MIVSELMTRAIETCAPGDALNLAAQRMWDHDCGALPVLDADGRCIAMITDRDICMAAYTQGKRLDQLTVAGAASQGIVVVRDTDDIDAAERLMQRHRVRRLPVTGTGDRVVGILSLNDIARHAHFGKVRQDGLGAESIVRTLASICEHDGTQSHAAE